MSKRFIRLDQDTMGRPIPEPSSKPVPVVRRKEAPVLTRRLWNCPGFCVEARASKDRLREPRKTAVLSVAPESAKGHLPIISIVFPKLQSGTEDAASGLAPRRRCEILPGVKELLQGVGAGGGSRVGLVLNQQRRVYPQQAVAIPAPMTMTVPGLFPAMTAMTHPSCLRPHSKPQALPVPIPPSMMTFGLCQPQMMMQMPMIRGCYWGSPCRPYSDLNASSFANVPLSLLSFPGGNTVGAVLPVGPTTTTAPSTAAVAPKTIVAPLQLAAPQIQANIIVKKPSTLVQPKQRVPPPPEKKGQRLCCVAGCRRAVSKRRRTSMRLSTRDNFKARYLRCGWNSICNYHYFSSLYMYKKLHGLRRVRRKRRVLS